MRERATFGKVVLKGNATGGDPTTVMILGSGTDSLPLRTAEVNKNFIDFRLKCTGASGTTRGAYLKLFLTGGAGGEALRAVLKNESNTPADTVNGSHISLMFGTTAGNITGLATAGRFTVHIPGRAINGTVGAVQAELYGDAASGAVGGTMGFIRCCLAGHADFKGSFMDSGSAIVFSGLTAGAAHMFRTGLTANNSLALMTAAMKIDIDGVAYFLPLLTGTNG